jgi:curved DNA-binding protein CbpA
MPQSQVGLPTINHYEVLGVPPTASLQQIRENFKRLVLEAHPDKNPHRPEWSEKRIRELIEAFEVVGNEQARAEFDRLISVTDRARRGTKQEKPFFYSKKDPEARALLILHHLLNRRPQIALSLLGEMEGRLGTNYLAENLDRADYLDCLFLLAEYYADNRKYLSAARKLGALYAHERDARYPRHYFEQVVARLKDLYLRKLPRHASAGEALAGLKEAKELGLTKAEELVRLQRLAEVHASEGELDEAVRWLSRAEQLAPGDPATKKVEATLRAAGRKKVGQ